MASPVDELVEYFRRLRDENVAHSAQMEAGDFSVWKMDGNDRVDVTADEIRRLRQRADEFDAIITAHQGKGK